MTIQTQIAALPELEQRFVRRALWLLGGTAAALVFLWSAWDVYAPWRTASFLRAAGLRGVSYDAVRDATDRHASFAPVVVAAAGFFLSAVVIIVLTRTSRSAERDVRRATVAMAVAMTVAVGAYGANQIRAAAEAGHRLSQLARVTQSSVDSIAAPAGVRVSVLANVNYGPAGHRAHLPGPVLAVGGLGFSSSDTVYGYDAVGGRAFSSSASPTPAALSSGRSEGVRGSLLQIRHEPAAGFGMGE